MQGRRTAALTAAIAVTASLLVPSAATSARAKPKKPRPNLGIAAVLGVPKEVQAGGRFAVKVLLGNDGQAAAPPARLSVHLSRDTKKSAGDLAVGHAKSPKLGPWKTRVAPAKIAVPGTAKRGAYYVIACVAGRKSSCHPSATTVEVIRPVDGTLRGTIDLFDTGAAGPRTWNRTAHLDVALRLHGKGLAVKVTDIGSSYSWLGESQTLVVVPPCSTTHAEDEDRTGPFERSDLGYASLGGRVGNSRLSLLELEARMTYAVTGQITSPCTPPVPITESREMLTGIDLVQVSATESTITYKVGKTWAWDFEPSDWDAAQGTLTLKLK